MKTRRRVKKIVRGAKRTIRQEFSRTGRGGTQRRVRSIKEWADQQIRQAARPKTRKRKKR